MAFLDLFRKRKKITTITELIEEETHKIPCGVAFGGGGARGFGHIGAVKAFEENNIDFKYVAGTSVGSMIGAMYAMGLKSSEMIDIAKNLKESDIRTSKFILVPSKSSNIEHLMKKYIGDVVFSDLKKPFTAVAVDMRTGEEVHLRNGLVARAVSASCAVPAVFTPVIWQDFVLQDGGLSNPVPSDVAREMGAKVVVSIDINSSRGYGTESTKMFDILSASLRISMKATARKGIENSDIIIQPNLRSFKSTKFEGMEQMIEEGYEATIEKMDDIKQLLQVY